MSPVAVHDSVLLDALGTRHEVARGEVRIVSLVPSLTELICDLGLTDRLVGRTGFCVHPRAALKAVRKVGGTKDVRHDTIRALAPTHLVVNVDENRREDVEALAAHVPHVIVTHPCAPEDNFDLYRLFGGIFGREAEAARLATALEGALAEAHAVAGALPRERVLYLIWRAPWMSVARDTYISATLRTCGWDTVPVEAASRYPVVEGGAAWQEAERIFLSTEPYRFRPQHLAELASFCDRPAALIDGEMTSWYGSRAASGLRYLAALRRSLSAG